MSVYSIQLYESQYQDQVINLILSIQQSEFGIPITINDQPDLLNIDSYYQTMNGNFWIAIANNRVVGTIGLKDIGNGQSCIRKMFVHQEFRGGEMGTAKKLLASAM